MASRRRLTASECILARCSRVVRDLYASTLAHRVVIKVDVGALIEAVMRGLVGGRREVVVDICKAFMLLEFLVAHS